MRTKTVFFVFVFGTCFFWARTAQGDTIKLKNGTSINGEIIAETATEYTIEVPQAGGSIRTKETIAKSDVTEIARATPEQKAESAYKDTLRYKLDPNQSYGKDYYERILDGVLRKFLTDYPNSAFEKEMNERIVQWQDEHHLVSTGFMKQNGRWILITEQLLAQAQSSFTARQYPNATQLLEQLFNSNPTEEVATKAKELRKKVYQEWLQWLQQQKIETQAKLTAAETEFSQANKKLEAARSEIAKAGYKGFTPRQ